jgi:hypothetical protein
MLTAGTASAVGFCHDCSCSPCGSGAGCGHWFGHGVCTACVPTTEGCCFCHEGIFCADGVPCGDSGDCPGGWACAITCCGSTPICVPPSGNPAGFCVDGVAQAGGPTSTGAGGGASRHGGNHEEAPAHTPSKGHGGHQ